MMPSTSSTSVNQPSNSYVDPYLSNSGDNPYLLLVSTQFNGNNFLAWRRSIRMSLNAKNKSCFVTGKLTKPAITSDTYQKWFFVDHTVMSWLLASIIPAISGSLMYCSSSKDLWEEIEERYGQSDSLTYYELQSELYALKQENLTLAEYYGKLRQIWEDMACIGGVPECTCGVLSTCTCAILKQILEADKRQKRVKFLMGLNPCYETLRTNILSANPLPAVNVAYSQLLRAEKQRNMSQISALGNDSSALAATRRPFSQTFSPSFHSPYKRDVKKKKKNRLCTYCQKNGHSFDTCFARLDEIPDWYTQLKGKKAVQSSKVNMVSSYHEPDNPLDVPTQSPCMPPIDPALLTNPELLSTMFNQFVQSQMASGSFSGGHHANFAGTTAVLNAVSLHKCTE